MKKKIIIYLLSGLLFPVLQTGCIYEHPELTESGEIGEDPTLVTLEANLNLNFDMPSSTAEGEAIRYPGMGGIPAYRHRIIIEAYQNRVCMARKVMYKEIEDGVKKLSVPVSMKLHARNYEIAVWCDYVQMPNEENGIPGTEDYFYNTISGGLTSIYEGETYRGNNEYKDAFCGTANLNLEDYRDQWGKLVSLDIQMRRPVARVQFTANDVADFVKAIESGSISGDRFVAKISYRNYLNMGYNVLESLPRHGLLYLSYKRTFKIADLKPGENFLLLFDYVFVGNKDFTSIPVTLEIWDKDEKNVLAATLFNVNCKAGYYTDITYRFLTTEPDGGISFRPDFDGQEEIEIPARPDEIHNHMKTY